MFSFSNSLYSSTFANEEFRYNVMQTVNGIEVSVSFFRHKTFGNPADDEEVDVIMSKEYASRALMAYFRVSRANIKGLYCKNFVYNNDVVTFVYQCSSIEILQLLPQNQVMQTTALPQSYRYSSKQEVSVEQVQNQSNSTLQGNLQVSKTSQALVPTNKEVEANLKNVSTNKNVNLPQKMGEADPSKRISELPKTPNVIINTSNNDKALEGSGTKNLNHNKN